ncbi:hypothetical protein A2U01_0072560, partial [Trifolium medium]|nr:hypothetical protein [Trifolium medium]
HDDGDHDTVPRSPPREYEPVLTPVGNNQEQTPVDNTGDQETAVKPLSPPTKKGRAFKY